MNKLLYISTLLVGAVLTQPLPPQVNVTVNPESLLIEVTVAVNDNLQTAQFQVDNNAAQTTSWLTGCVQNADLATTTDLNCTAAPTLVTEYLNFATGSGTPVSNFPIAGYYVSGEIDSLPFYILPFNATEVTYVEDANITLVSQIESDKWLYNQPVAQGSVAMGLNSPLLLGQAENNNLTYWGLKVGCVGNQLFGNLCETAEGALMYVGAGDWNELWDPSPIVTINITRSEDGTFPLGDIFFGDLDFVGADKLETLTQLGNPNMTANNLPRSAIISTTFQGLGLPQYEYNQFLSIIYKSGVNLDIVPFTEGPGDHLQMNMPCEAWTALQDSLTFQIFFEGASNWVLIPLGAFAVDFDGVCNIYVQNLDTEMDSHIILGSLFMAQFLNYFENDYNMNQQRYAFQFDKNDDRNVFGYTYIGNYFILQPNPANPGYFQSNLSASVMPVPINVNSNQLTLGVMGSINYQNDQNFTEFRVNFGNDQILTYAQSCATCQGTFNYLTTPYFNDTGFNTSIHQQGGPYNNWDGWKLSYSVVEAPYCLQNSNPIATMQCTTSNVNVSAVVDISSDYWNTGVAAASGTIGLGWGSSVWYDLFYCSANSGFGSYTVKVSNMTDWSWLSADFVPAFTDSSLLLCDIPTFEQNLTTTFQSSEAEQNQLLELSVFGFGKYYNESNSANFQNMLNSNASASLENQKALKVSMDFRGVGLPPLAYKRFQSLLQAATGLYDLCSQYNGGICMLPGNCSSYPTLWDYSFGVQFSGNSSYLVIPLAIFAKDDNSSSTDHPEPTCNIYAQYLDAQSETDTYNLQIVLGSMFFQSFYMNVQQSPQTTFTFAVNDNAPPGTYITNDTVTVGPSAFQIQPNRTVPLTDKGLHDHEMPLFNGSVADIADADQYYFLDFNYEYNLFWDESCRNFLSGVRGGECSGAPINANDTFHTGIRSGNSPIEQHVLYKQNGFSVNASSYNEPILFNDRSYTQYSYVAERVYQDNWLYNYGATYGVLGLGPESVFWQSMIGDNNAAVYSFSVNKTRIQFSNITLGSVDNGGDYLNAIGVTLTPVMKTAYEVSGMSFGKIYYTGSTPTSAYLSSLTTQAYHAHFSLAYPGLGLPSAVYQEWKSLMSQLFPDFQCSSGINAECAVWGSCQDISDLVFEFNFTGSSNTFRMPLPTFGMSPGNPPLPSLQADNCQLRVFELPEDQSVGTNLIVFGPQFFGEFYAEFTNQWTQVNFTSFEVSQSVKIYENVNREYPSMIAAQQLPIGENPFINLALPFKLEAKILSGSYLLAVPFQTTEGEADLLIETGSSETFIFAQGCTIWSYLATTTNTQCSGAPTFVTEVVNSVLPTKQVQASGYTLYGADVMESLTITAANGTTFKQTGQILSVHEIYNTTWLYNVSSGVGAGQASFSLDNYDSIFNLNGDEVLKWSVEVGQVADQSFTGRPYQVTEPQLYIGNGDYSVITGPKNALYPNLVAITAQSEANGLYNLHQLQFGNIQSDDGQLLIAGQMEDLSNPNYADSVPLFAEIKLNYQGLGLPAYAFERWVSLMLRGNFTNPFTNQPDLRCDNGQPNMCHLSQSCDFYQWNLAFNFQFVKTGTSLSTQTYVSLSSFAVDNAETGECDLYVQNLGTPSDQPVLLGTLFLQNFVAYFENDYNTETQSMTLYISPQNRIPGTYQGGVISNDDYNPFNFISYPQVWDITIQPTFTPTVKANADFSGWSNYKLNLGALSHTVVSNNCTAVSNNQNVGSCKDYYNTVDIFPLESYKTYPGTNQELMGITAQTAGVFGNFCVMDHKYNALCTRLYSQEMQVAYEIFDNNWSVEQYQGAGSLGLNIQASWVQYLFNYQYSGFTLQLSNFTDLTFAQSDYKPYSTQNYLAFSDTKPSTTTYIQIPYVNWSFNSVGYLSTKEFSFGLIYPNSTEYFQSILNTEGNYNINSTILSLDLNGLGLPTRSYIPFIRMVNYETNGGISCTESGPNPGCYLPKTCVNYQSLWQYRFRAQFSNQQESDLYFLLPVATIAADVKHNGQTVCKLYVTELPQTSYLNSNIILGSMFFQQLSLFMHQDSYATTYFRLYVNPNALNATQITNATYGQAPTPFQKRTATLPVSVQNGQNSGIAAVTATVDGISASPAQFFIDFSNEKSVVWSQSCTVNNTLESCADPPLNLQLGFDDAAIGPYFTSDYSGVYFNGFNTSGKVFQTEVCIGSQCKVMPVHDAQQVHSDTMMYNSQGSYGILGFGPLSPIWYVLTDPATNSAQYSIALARTAQGKDSAVVSNITLGGVSDESYYNGQVNLALSAKLPAGMNYSLSSFSFGYTNGTTNEYYAAITQTNAELVFDTVFQGLGLPNSEWTQFTTMIYDYLQGQECLDTGMPDVGCRLVGTCQSWYSKLGEFNFKIGFSSDTTNYIRVPLYTFAVDEVIAGNDTCNFLVQNLQSSITQNQYQLNQVVLGGMFFQEFYGQFTNTYTTPTTQLQSARIFVGMNAMYGGYIGSSVLPVGPDPFTPYHPPTPPTPANSSLLWLWILLGALVVLLVIVVLVVKCYKRKGADANYELADEGPIGMEVEGPDRGSATGRLTTGRVNKSDVESSRLTTSEGGEEHFDVERV